MNNPQNEPLQTVVISTDAQTTSKPSNLGKILSIVLLLLVLAIGGAVFFLFQQSKQHHLKSDENIAQLQRHLSHVNMLVDQQAQILTATQKQLQTLLDQQNTQKQGGYVLEEVKYLVNLASFHLMFENNIRLARQLLETADQRISNSATSAFLPLRQAFAKDIAMLDAAPTVDLTGLMARLQTLSEQAESLPEIPITLEKEITVDKKTETSLLPTTEQPTHLQAFWGKIKAFTQAVGHTLSTMVIISKDDKSTPTLLTKEERNYVVTNLQSQLTLAQWAVVHRQLPIYQQSLLQVSHWLQHYFSTNDPLIQSMLKTIETLKQVSISPEVPTLSRSLNALAQVKLSP